MKRIRRKIRLKFKDQQRVQLTTQLFPRFRIRSDAQYIKSTIAKALTIYFNKAKTANEFFIFKMTSIQHISGQ